MTNQSYYFITVFEKINTSEKGLLTTGCSRCWGFYLEKETAIQALHENWTDMWETVYDYAVIEEYYEGISDFGDYRQFFKYNLEKDSYIEIEEPEVVKHYCGFAFG